MQKRRQGDSCITPKEIFAMGLVNFVTIVVLKIWDNLFSMQNSLNPNKRCCKQNLENCPT